MDEECLRPGEPTDKSFLAKMNENLSHHKHYISHKKAGGDSQKPISHEVRSKIHFHCCISFFRGGGISWDLKLMCQCSGTPCLFHLHWSCEYEDFQNVGI